jgi:hypothetical protein
MLRPGGRLIAKCASKNATGGPGGCYSHPGFIFAPPEGSLPLPLMNLSRDKVRQNFFELYVKVNKLSMTVVMY